MVAGEFGHAVPLRDLRARFGDGLRGSHVQRLMEVADALDLGTRALRLELDELPQLKTPCILHWDLNHFVVLLRVKSGRIHLWDPALGARRLRLAAASSHFTGVALEVTPRSDFQFTPPPPRVPLRALTGRVVGLKRSLAQILAMAAVLELIALAQPLLNQFVVDDAIATHDADLLTLLAFGFGLLLAAQTTVALARSWMVMVLSQSITLQWSGNLFAHLTRLPLPWFERRHLGDIVSRFSAMGAIQQLLTTQAIEAVLDGLMAGAALTMMLLYSGPMTLMVLAAVLAYALLRMALYRPLRDASAERLVLAAREQSHFLETLRSMLPLKLFGRESDRVARWQNLLIEVQNRDVRTARLGIVFAAANTLIFGIENLAVFWYGAHKVMGGESATPFTIGMLFAFVAYKGQFTGRMAQLIDHAMSLRMLGLHTERLADIALAAPESTKGTQSSARRAARDSVSPSIEMRNVSFRYAEGLPWVLRHVNLQIAPGDHVAIVGSSGGGKTTLLKILLGLLEPSEGDVLFGGVPLRDLGLSTARAWVGAVMQDDALLAGSIADNIGFFDVDLDRARIEACAKLAGIHDDIEALAMGYDSLVGELGSTLSGGQKQRVLLARALYKQPRVLVLDEATSHLDAKRERAIARTLARSRITRVVVAHRAETIAAAQRVLVLEAGRLRPLGGEAPAGRSGSRQDLPVAPAQPVDPALT